MLRSYSKVQDSRGQSPQRRVSPQRPGLKLSRIPYLFIIQFHLTDRSLSLSKRPPGCESKPAQPPLAPQNHNSGEGERETGRSKSHTCALNTLGLIYCGDACSVNRSELDITGGTSVDEGGRSADQVHGTSRRPTGQLAGGFHNQRKVRVDLQKGVQIARSRGRLSAVVPSLNSNRT